MTEMNFEQKIGLFLQLYLPEFLLKSTLKTNGREYFYLGDGPNRRRPEDVGIVREGIEREDILKKDRFAEIIRESVNLLVSRIFAGGQPFGFYNLNLPGSLTHSSKTRWEDPWGVVVRHLVGYDILTDGFILRLDSRPEYDETVGRKLVTPIKPAVPVPYKAL